MRRTKIVCTIGPASQNLDMLKVMISSGMDIARLNFSHGTHSYHQETIKLVEQASQELGIPTALLLDTKGPEIRIGMVENDKTMLETGQQLILTTEEVLGNKERISITYPGLVHDVNTGCEILLDDGLIVLKVQEVKDKDIICEVISGGEIRNQKGVNVPGIEINLPAITEKDVEDIIFGIKNGFDFIAASFTRKASDVLEIRRILEEYNSDIHIIAKIENRQGVDNIEEILKVADGIMVARGDLGVEIPAEEVPLVQKMIIDKCNQVGKPVITATQMLESMTTNPRPTRAEASDVANAILDGTDAIMLSGETAAGKYPVESVKTMAKIAQRSETALRHEEIVGKNPFNPKPTITDAISYATVSTAEELGAAAIITATKSGHTARMVSKFRPKAPIVAVTTTKRVLHKLKLVWGVKPIIAEEAQNTDGMFAASIQGALDYNYISCGDLVVITAGVPVGVPGTTNLLKVHIIGDVVAEGTAIGNKAVTGKAIIANTADEAMELIKEGDILVTHSTDKAFMPVLEKVKAIITEAGGLTSHAAIVALNLGIPVVLGVENATKLLKAGEIYTIDGIRGVVYRGVTKVL